METNREQFENLKDEIHDFIIYACPNCSEEYSIIEDEYTKDDEDCPDIEPEYTQFYCSECDERW